MRIPPNKYEFTTGLLTYNDNIYYINNKLIINDYENIETFYSCNYYINLF